MKTVSIKGKEYVEVSQRILHLAEKHAEHYEIKTDYQFFESLKMWVVKATLTIHAYDNTGEAITREFTGHAQEIIDDGYINKTSALENCETSAVGRACAMAGIGIVDGIASVDEINKAQNRQYTQPEPSVPKQSDFVDVVRGLFDECVELGWSPDKKWNDFYDKANAKTEKALTTAYEKLEEIKKGF